MLTDRIESCLSTYDRYIEDKKNKEVFARLNRSDYLKCAYVGLMTAINYFSDKYYFDSFKFFVRGSNLTFPKLIQIEKDNLIKNIVDIEKEQLFLIKKDDLENRIKKIENNLETKEEIYEFNKIINEIIIPIINPILNGGKKENL